MPELSAVIETKAEVAPFQYKEIRPGVNPLPVTLMVSPTLPIMGDSVNVVGMITLNKRMFAASRVVETWM